jgi:predicted NAD/FAD-dependent oxidoreductase
MALPAVTVVGAGISGLACAGALVAAGLDVSVRERARAVGGRMATRRVAAGDRPRVADIGAAYFTARDPDFQAQVNRWCAAGLARPWTDRLHTLTATGLAPGEPGPMRYATPGGLRSLVRDLAGGLGPEVVQLESPVESVTAGPATVLAMPDPQAARLLAPTTSAYRAVAGRRWEPVLSLTALFPQRSWPEFDGAFVNDHPTLSFVADDGSRRGDGAPVLVAHSTGPFASSHLDDPPGAAPDLLAALDGLLGCGAPAWSHVHRWTYARPAEPRDEPYHWDDERIGVCGDGWGSPRVETAWRSGRALGRRIAADLGGGG